MLKLITRIQLITRQLPKAIKLYFWLCEQPQLLLSEICFHEILHENVMKHELLIELEQKLCET